MHGETILLAAVAAHFLEEVSVYLNISLSHSETICLYITNLQKLLEVLQKTQSGISFAKGGESTKTAYDPTG